MGKKNLYLFCQKKNIYLYLYLYGSMQLYVCIWLQDLKVHHLYNSRILTYYTIKLKFFIMKILFLKYSFNVALNNYFLSLNEVKFVKLTAETLFQYKMVTTHFLINALQPDQPPIHLCCHLSMLNAISMFSSMLQACNYKRAYSLLSHEWWDLPFMWDEGLCIYGTPGVPNNFPYKRGAKLNVMFVPFLFLFSRFLYKSINNKRFFFLLFFLLLKYVFIHLLMSNLYAKYSCF